MNKVNIIGKPFVTSDGEVVTVKSIATIKNKVTMVVESITIEVNESSRQYKERELTPMSMADYQAHLKLLEDEDIS